MNYCSLHSHTYYSLLDGAGSPLEYMQRAKELDMPAFAITDHGTPAGHREAQRAAKETGVNVILGMEAYITHDRFDRRSKASRQDGTSIYNHVTVLAQNQDGLDTLARLNKAAWEEGYYYKPRMDTELLFDDNSGLIVASGCMSGMVAKPILEGNEAQAWIAARAFKDALGDRFYMEVMGPNDPMLNHKLLEIADKLDIKPIMTSDCHYVNKEDLPVENALLILATGLKPIRHYDYEKSTKMDLLERFNYLYPGRTMNFEEIEVYLRSIETERALFEKQDITRTDIYSNTLEIVDRIGDYSYFEALDLLPKPKTADPKKMLRKMVYDGLKERGMHEDQAAIDRVEYELSVIFDKNFETYFLIIADALNWARKQGIKIGPGRGSGASSLVNYSLRITEVDPLKYNLLFMRFMDPERDDWPDIDVDIEDERRAEVRTYIEKKFGHVTGIATVLRFHGKSSIREAAKVLAVPLYYVNSALKDNDAALEVNNSYDYYDWFLDTLRGKAFNKCHPDVLPMARAFFGKVKTMGQHPSALVVSKEPVDKYAPVQTVAVKGSKERVSIIALDKDEAERIGFIKLDFLGLKTLRIISHTAKLIKARHGLDIDFPKLELDDPKVYQMISELKTRGVFQLDKPAYTGLVRDMGGINNFDELVASNALVRPGAMQTIGPAYILRKSGKADVQYLHPDIKPFTEDTYGLCTLFQEQVMLVMTELAGMTMQEANEVRRVVSKKKDVALLESYREQFIDGASKKVTQAQAIKLWKDIEAQAAYSFNKAHSVAYSMLSYWTAWLKVHYPKEYLTACLRAANNGAEMTDFLIEMKRMDIKVLLPHVNKSNVLTDIEGDGVRLGLSSLKFVGASAAQKIIASRPFENYEQLQTMSEEKFSGVSTRVLDMLNRVGGAAFPDNPLTGNEKDSYYDVLNIPHFNNEALPVAVEAKIIKCMDYDEEGIGFLRVILRKIQKKNNWARADLLDDTGSTGLFCDYDIEQESGKMYLVLAVDNRAFEFIDIDEVNQESTLFRYLMNDLPSMHEGQHWTVAWRDYTTKAGKEMAYLVAADHLGHLKHVIVFPQKYAKSKALSGLGRVWEAHLNEKEDGTIMLGDYIG